MVMATVVLLGAWGSAPGETLTRAQAVALLEHLDREHSHPGDYRAEFYLEEKAPRKDDLVYDGIVYRRDKDRARMILFVAPRTERGQGYLRLAPNVWFYDPRTGTWERRTERERIGGTSVRGVDFDQLRLSQEYDPTPAGVEMLGSHRAYVLSLKAKPRVDVPFPTVKLWLDQSSKALLKRQDFAASGRLLRSCYILKYARMYSKARGGAILVPKEIRVFDEVIKGSRTILVIKKVYLEPFTANIFTKAWFESQSR
jgi:hypothetical protein